MQEKGGIPQAKLVSALRARKEGIGAPTRKGFLTVGPLNEARSPQRRFLRLDGDGPPRGPYRVFSDFIDKIAEMGSRGGGGEGE